jgi:hypothetical protein
MVQQCAYGRRTQTIAYVGEIQYERAYARAYVQPAGRGEFCVETRTGWRDCRNFLTDPKPLQVLNKPRKRLYQFSTNRSGSLVITTTRLGLQCSAPSGACESLATSETRARMNSARSARPPPVGKSAGSTAQGNH